MTNFLVRRALFVVLALGIITASQAADTSQPFKIPKANLHEQIIWGSTCQGANGYLLGFGGQDQIADEIPRTRVQVEGKWQSLSEELRRKSPLNKQHELCLRLATQIGQMASLRRAAFFRGMADALVNTDLQARLRTLAGTSDSLTKSLGEQQKHSDDYARQQAKYSAGILGNASTLAEKLVALDTAEQCTADACGLDTKLLRMIEQAAESIDAEPPPRFLSPLVYDSQSKLFVLFGGDHGDYLTNDLWLFDPAQRKWEQRHPEKAPSPRGGHILSAPGNGMVKLTGGYQYTSSMSYCGDQYEHIKGGEWTYDLAANAWTGKENQAAPEGRVYRTEEFDPAFYLRGPQVDPLATQQDLKGIPANFWVQRLPPHQPQMMRTWGHAVLDSDHDQILVFGGGHSAHGGSDVLHYHLATNRWELPFPVEFPLGQTFSNTEYPEGFNLNRRPWVTGHTYQGYQYDPGSKQMYFVGRVHNTYVYDPALGDWTGRFPKPEPMVYGDCFYTLPLVTTRHGLICWTGRGGIFQLDAAGQKWQEIIKSGIELPGAVVDSSMFVYDSQRDRLLFFRAEYGQKYEGEVYSLQLPNGEVSKLSPPNVAALAALERKGISSAMYDPQHDLVLLGALLPGKAADIPRTLAFDCAKNEWVSLAIGFKLDKEQRALHPYGQGHSCGLMYDAKRQLLWGVDTHELRVFALRLELNDAVRKALK